MRLILTPLGSLLHFDPSVPQAPFRLCGRIRSANPDPAHIDTTAPLPLFSFIQTSSYLTRLLMMLLFITEKTIDYLDAYSSVSDRSETQTAIQGIKSIRYKYRGISPTCVVLKRIKDKQLCAGFPVL